MAKTSNFTAMVKWTSRLPHRKDAILAFAHSLPTPSELIAEGAFTHGHTLYGLTELTAARNGFKHRPSVTVYNPEPQHVVRVGAGEQKFINGRTQEGPFFAVYHGRLRNIALVSTPGDPSSDSSGSILAQSQGVSIMSTESNQVPQNTLESVVPPANTPESKNVHVVSPANTPEPPQSIEATARPVSPAPAVFPPVPPALLDQSLLSKMYERGDISLDIMAQAVHQKWSLDDLMKARNTMNAVNFGVDGKPNVAGFPQVATKKKDEPNGDMIMAAAAFSCCKVQQETAKRRSLIF